MTTLLIPDQWSHSNVTVNDHGNLTLAIINFRSIVNKKAEFLHFIQQSKPDLIIGTETWLTDDILNNEIIPNEFQYSIYRNDRNGGYGGVMIAVSKNIVSMTVPELISSCETIWCKLCIPSVKIIYVCAYYRPHISDQNSLDQLNISLATLKEQSNDSIIWLAGDFNAPNIDWDLFDINPGSNYPNTQANLIDITHEYGLSQLVKVPTRQDHILDLFFTNHPQQVEKIDVLPGLSDHDIVSIQLKCKPILQRQSRREILLFNKANWEAIRSGLEAFYQQVCNIDLNSVDVNALWSQFCTTLTELTTTHVPVKITRSKCSLPWITTKIRKMIRKRNRLYSMYKSTHSVTLHEQYKSLKHTIQREIRSSHQRYVSSLISTGNEEGQQPYHRNNKKLWTYIKGLRKDNSGIPPLSVNGTVTSNSSQKSEMLSNHFNSVFTTEDLDNFPDKGPSPHPVIENINVCSNGIRNQLNSLDVHKATGPDGISARILKETSDISALILRIIFVSSLEHGIVPSDWKIAHVVPVFKKGDRSNPCNYRPISLTSIVSKVLEHILSSHIMKHLESNGILHSCQHGFRHNRSCESQLISLVHELMQNHDNNIQSDIILTDFHKLPKIQVTIKLLYNIHLQQ